MGFDSSVWEVDRFRQGIKLDRHFLYTGRPDQTAGIPSFDLEDESSELWCG